MSRTLAKLRHAGTPGEGAERFCQAGGSQMSSETSRQ
jgi:hypothetical protein